MKGSVKLFRIFGIDIKLHFTWWFVFALLTWALSSSFFPTICSTEFTGFSLPCTGFTTKTYWFMGISASLLLFFSVLLHELSHSLVAKAKKIKVESITLFFFGGVAGIDDEDMKPMDELQMSLAGPIFSLILAGICFAIFKFNGNVILTGIMYYLFQLNLILAIFNLVPGYPLDGGRAFRAILYAYYKDLKKATRIAVKGGKFFAGVLIFLGIFSLITGVMNGLWFIFLGGFLWFIAGMSYEQVVIKETLSKLPVKKLIEKKFPKVDPNLTFSQALGKYYAFDRDAFVVQKGSKFIGILNLKKIVRMNLEMQKKVKVRELIVPIAKIKPVSPNDSSYKAFRSMLTQDLAILPVMVGNSLKGIISRKALMHRLVMELKYGVSLNGDKKKIVKKKPVKNKK